MRACSTPACNGLEKPTACHVTLVYELAGIAADRPLRVVQVDARRRAQHILLCGAKRIDCADIAPVAAFFVRSYPGNFVTEKVVRECAMLMRQGRQDVMPEVRIAAPVGVFEPLHQDRGICLFDGQGVQPGAVATGQNRGKNLHWSALPLGGYLSRNACTPSSAPSRRSARWICDKQYATYVRPRTELTELEGVDFLCARQSSENRR